MEYFKKDDFEQLKNLPRSEAQKKLTMNRIHNSKKPPRIYPIKYIITSIAVVVLAIVLIVPELLHSKQHANEPAEDITNEISTLDSDEIISTILNSLDIGLSEEEVTQIFEEYLSTKSVIFIGKNSDPIWRYKIQKNEDYIIGDSYIEIGEMEKAEIDMLLFIYWDEQRKVEHYSAIYKDGADGQFYDIRKLKNRTVLKQPISTEKVNTDNIFIDLEVIKTHLKVGMTMDEVIKELGNHFTTGVETSNGTLGWTYNFGEDSDKNNDGGYDFKELEEMLKGKFQARFHIYWDQNNLYSYIYGIYLNKEENTINEFGLFPEGQSKDVPIYNSFENKEIEIQLKSEEEQKYIAETYTYDTYKRIFDDVVTAAEFYSEEEQLKKWIIRTLVQVELYYETELSVEQVIGLAKQELKKDKMWKQIAKDEYGITVSDKEIDAYINDGPDTSDLPQHLAYADALGLTLKELNHSFDRDLYEKNVLWLKLKPILERKYGMSDNNQLVEKYEEEVNK